MIPPAGVARGAPVPPPPGDGPLLWLRLAASLPGEGAEALAMLLPALRAARRGIRVHVTRPGGGAATAISPDPGDSPAAAEAALRAWRPSVLLLVGGDLPEELLAAAGRARIPAVMADARIGQLRAPLLWQRSRRRAALEAVRRVLVPDTAAELSALRAGFAPNRIERIGRLEPTRPPPGCSEAERVVLAAALRGRQLWFACGVPEAEEDAVLAAHEAALAHSHRGLLLLQPSDPARATALAAKAEAAGFVPGLRSQTDDPAPDLQVLIADDPGEAGLWYRLAPVTYAGGTLSGAPGAGPHPFAPAALGSAILRGPHAGPEAAEEWAALDAARAVRPVADAAELGRAVDELLAPVRAAELAARAWRVSTAGAGVAQAVAAVVAGLLPA